MEYYYTSVRRFENQFDFYDPLTQASQHARSTVRQLLSLLA